ncbi:hypothetical protein DFA_11957 [Cavenderia fasciculata]|uniref:Uncharacterized protein n=1 Tax=Cavenderia fasciculata TaxID=261658 RepID=F4QEY1_CACFS|nr:uncharacterized protein DFA_11957 [Cavenderia fasciculata]EGG14188.1 hypothetical protein DFA_11957 [Cavenderia fasciculata]|eukprot:XP_004350896.1 hypothetical protein DFA_11957 [Cavenderia fasciculata]
MTPPLPPPLPSFIGYLNRYLLYIKCLCEKMCDLCLFPSSSSSSSYSSEGEEEFGEYDESNITTDIPLSDQYMMTPTATTTTTTMYIERFDHQEDEKEIYNFKQIGQSLKQTIFEVTHLKIDLVEGLPPPPTTTMQQDIDGDGIILFLIIKEGGRETHQEYNHQYRLLCEIWSRE